MTRMTSNEIELLDKAQAVVEQSLKVHDSLEKRLFKAAFKLVEDPGTWCRGVYKRTVENVTRFCSLGALEESEMQLRRSGCFGDSYSSFATARYRVVVAISNAMGMDVPSFNDTHTHAQVVAMWRRTGEIHGWL